MTILKSSVTSPHDTFVSAYMHQAVNIKADPTMKSDMYVYFLIFSVLVPGDQTYSTYVFLAICFEVWKY